jgi:hypothetical protein
VDGFTMKPDVPVDGVQWRQMARAVYLCMVSPSVSIVQPSTGPSDMSLMAVFPLITTRTMGYLTGLSLTPQHYYLAEGTMLQLHHSERFYLWPPFLGPSVYHPPACPLAWDNQPLAHPSPLLPIHWPTRVHCTSSTGPSASIAHPS